MTIQIYTGDSDVFDEQQKSLRQSTLHRPHLERSDVRPTERWLIVGAGGFGREVYSWTLGHLRSNGAEYPIGFLDDNPASLDPFPDLKGTWIGAVSNYAPLSGDRLLMAIGDPAAKLEVGERLVARGAVFASYVHPTAVLAHDVAIGAGCIICPLAVICANVHLGNFVLMNVGALAGHDSSIGDGCTLSPHSDVAGQVILERGVFLGCQTVVLPKTRIGEFARIGAGSVVISHVKAHVSMMGVPAKRINWSQGDDDDDESLAS